MGSAIPITDDIYWGWVDDWETERFENIWPLPHGISYNSYLIIGPKTVLIDTIKRSFLPNYLETLKSFLTESMMGAVGRGLSEGGVETVKMWPKG